MKELRQILDGFDALAAEKKPAALATVVQVNGSAYRRPGARMLVAADGRTWGGVSGGCLERDVSRRARNVIATGTPLVCTYDTSDELDEVGDEAELLDRGRSPGAMLGCRGVIDIFIQPISASRPGPVPAIGRCVRLRETITNATVIRATRGCGLQPGDPFPLDVGDVPERPELRVLDVVSGGSVEVFVETLRPPQSLVIFGSGSDVVPVVQLARVLGWHVTVAASRRTPTAVERFALADGVVLADGDRPAAGVPIETGTAVVLMTHDVARDRAILRELANRPLRYLGVLGPRSRTDEVLARLPGEQTRAQLFYPVGLDIGADQPELIALAIVAEIQGVLSGRPGGSLRDRPGPIYPPHRSAACDPVR